MISADQVETPLATPDRKVALLTGTLTSGVTNVQNGVLSQTTKI